MINANCYNNSQFKQNLKLKKFLLSLSIIAGKIFKRYFYNISTTNKNRDL